MANHKSAQKRIRANESKRLRNRYTGKTTRNAVRDLQKNTDPAAAKKDLPEVIALVDKLAKNKVIHKNKAANIKSKLMKKVLAAK
ncbi:MAG: 30S ribosomal protein S20 [Bacteroidota bacterium]|jgi:small subunit ribosomal protein S20